MLEVDEHQHRHQPPLRDPRRDLDVCASVALGSGGKTVFLRYSPDAFRVGGVVQHIPKQTREARLLQVIAELDKEPELSFSRLFLYYDKETHESSLPIVALEWPHDVQQVSRCVDCRAP